MSLATSSRTRGSFLDKANRQWSPPYDMYSRHPQRLMQSIKTELESDEPTSSSISIVDVGLDTDEVIDEEIKQNFLPFSTINRSQNDCGTWGLLGTPIATEHRYFAMSSHGLVVAV